MNLKTESNKLSEVNSPIFNKNKNSKNNIILNNKNSLEKNKIMFYNNSYVNKSNRKNNCILKANDIKNINTNIINEEKKIIKRFSVKKDNSLSKK